MPAKEVMVILGSYALGCLTAGYYLVRLRTGADVRTRGSGSAGATNVGRALGVTGFALTFLADFVKGAIAVLAAFHFGLGSLGVVAAMNAVVIGHIWPVQLRFQGGKGVATALGAMLLFDYQLTIVLILLSGLGVALTKQFTLSGMIGVALSPSVAFLMGRPLTSVLGTALLAVLVLIAHRENISNFVLGMRQKRAKDNSAASIPR